ncbi:hypothetical protein LIA77_09006 [Sarocladium implicatum]|jgi:hypothetical protein|nr:hypothetical protein LIA77_09006 [Sarocladium implicatum]
MRNGTQEFGLSPKTTCDYEEGREESARAGGEAEELDEMGFGFLAFAGSSHGLRRVKRREGGGAEGSRAGKPIW